MIFTAQSLNSVCVKVSPAHLMTLRRLRDDDNENATTFSNAVCAYISTNPFLKSCRPGLSKMYELTLKILMCKKCA